MSSTTAVPIRPVKSSYMVWLWLGVIAAIALAYGLARIGTGDAVAAAMPNEDFLAWHKNQAGIQTTGSGLQYQVIEAGEGASAADQDGVIISVRGETRKGEEFQPESPMRFQVGQPMIPGFTEGVKLMKKGSKYRFWLPPSLGYGAEAGPENELSDQVLIFDVDMQDLVPAAVIQQMMMQQMQQQGGAPGGPPPGQSGMPGQ